MADDNLDVLLRTTDNTTMSLEQSKKFNNTKRKINGICKALSMNTQKYDPQKTVENIASYMTQQISWTGFFIRKSAIMFIR